MLLSTLFFIKNCEKVVGDYSLYDEINKQIYSVAWVKMFSH